MRTTINSHLSSDKGLTDLIMACKREAFNCVHALPPDQAMPMWQTVLAEALRKLIFPECVNPGDDDCTCTAPGHDDCTITCKPPPTQSCMAVAGKARRGGAIY
jgi:hypothetical protein